MGLRVEGEVEKGNRNVGRGWCGVTGDPRPTVTTLRAGLYAQPARYTIAKLSAHQIPKSPRPTCHAAVGEEAPPSLHTPVSSSQSSHRAPDSLLHPLHSAGLAALSSPIRPTSTTAPGNMAAAAAANGDVRGGGGGVPRPTNPMVTPLLTDLYQFSMAYAYWKAGKHLDRAVFDLYFRKNPFAGEFTIFGGLEECIRFIANFKFKEEEIRFLQAALPTCEDGFFEYLSSIDCSDVEVYAIPEGSVVFPKVPLMIIEGPVAVLQLLETPFLTLVNYASLVTTNAARHRLVAGKEKNLLEFGLRRAQGPDGGISASRYSYMGGFDATSNVAAGRLFGIPIRGTHSHAFVSSFMGLDEIIDKALSSSDGSNKCEDFVSLVQSWLIRIQDASSLRGTFGETNQSHEKRSAKLLRCCFSPQRYGV
ncbi:hypothetical protein ACQ4PT_070568 [Festuca glaucescens]